MSSGSEAQICRVEIQCILARKNNEMSNKSLLGWVGGWLGGGGDRNTPLYDDSSSSWHMSVDNIDLDPNCAYVSVRSVNEKAFDWVAWSLLSSLFLCAQRLFKKL